MLGADTPFHSMADTVFDVIRTDDPSTFTCLSYEGREVREMWDRRADAEFRHDAFVFRAHFADSGPVDIVLNPEFSTEDAARTEAERYTRPLGQLPVVLRQGIGQLGIHKGRETFHGGPGKIFLYQDQVTHRIGQNKLEESLMHEAVHASLDRQWRNAPEWRAAQAADGRFLTRYAQSRPDREDLADTMVFAFALLRHPGRIPPVDSRVILATVPARIAVIEKILAGGSSSDPPKPPDTCY